MIETTGQTDVRSGGPRFLLATGWDIFAHSVKSFQENGDGNLAASIAFYAILSAIPLLILTTLAAGLVFGSDPAVQKELLRVVRGFHPYISGELLKQLGKIEEKRRLLGGLGLITLAWTSSLIFNSLQNALGIIFRSPTPRNFFVGKLLAFAMIPIGWAVAGTNVAVTYIGGVLEADLQSRGGGGALGAELHVMLFRYLLPYLITVSFFTFVYRVIPTARVSLRHALAGSVLFSALMEITKHLFTWYMARSSQYSIVYGPLETVVILVVWVYYVSLILLFCAELISSYRKRDLILLEKALLRKRLKNAH